MVVVARDATLPHIDVDSVSLLETNHPSCSPAGVTSAFAIFQFAVTACGTMMKVGGEVIFCFLIDLMLKCFSIVMVIS